MLILHRKSTMRCYKSYGITGVSRGSGATSLCLMLANYLASARAKDVTYIELTNTSKLMDLVGKEFISKKEFTEYKKVRFMLAASVREATEMLDKRSGIIIVDISELNSETEKVFDKCERQIVIGSLRPWKKREYIEFIRNKVIKKLTKNNVLLLGQGIKNKEKKEMKDIFGIDIQEIGMIQDPYKIRERDFNKIERIIGK